MNDRNRNGIYMERGISLRLASIEWSHKTKIIRLLGQLENLTSFFRQRIRGGFCLTYHDIRLFYNVELMAVCLAIKISPKKKTKKSDERCKKQRDG